MYEEKEYFWRDIKCFNHLKEMIDIEKTASLSDKFSKSEISELLNVLCKLDKDGEISLKDAR